MADGDWDKLELYRLTKGLPTCYYIPDFITIAEEENLIRQIKQSPGPKWTQLANRRLQNWGGVPHPKGMIAEAMPAWLQTYVDRVNKLNIFGAKSANHVLLNEYLAGQGIMPHLDGALFHPTISTLSVGSHTVLNFYNQDSDQIGCDGDILPFQDRLVTSVWVERRSLLVLKDDLYNQYLHGIEERTSDVFEPNRTMNSDRVSGSVHEGLESSRETRYSLTIRHVPKTTKMKMKFFK